MHLPADIKQNRLQTAHPLHAKCVHQTQPAEHIVFHSQHFLGGRPVECFAQHSHKTLHGRRFFSYPGVQLDAPVDHVGATWLGERASEASIGTDRGVVWDRLPPRTCLRWIGFA